MVGGFGAGSFNSNDCGHKAFGVFVTVGVGVLLAVIVGVGVITDVEVGVCVGVAVNVVVVVGV